MCFYRFMSENNKKILGILPHSIAGRLIVKSMLDGFEQNGFNFDVYDELKQDNFLEFISNKDYNYITGYDFSPLKLKVDNDLRIPCVCYFADEIESTASGVFEDWQKYLPYLSEDKNFTFYWDRALAEKSNVKNLYYMPQFVNTEVYKPLNLEKEYDIMFAGRLDTDFRLNFFIELMQHFPNLKFAWYAIEKHYQDALSRTNEEGQELLKQAYKGFIDNEPDMAVAINKAKFMFTMNSQGISSLNHRTVQAVACKTLVVSDFREELNIYKGDLPFYINMGDLVEKINYYMQNEKAYEYTVNKSYEIASKYLSAEYCVKCMLKVMGN